MMTYMCPRCEQATNDIDGHLDAIHDTTAEVTFQQLIRQTMGLLISKLHRLDGQTSWDRQPVWLRAAIAAEILDEILADDPTTGVAQYRMLLGYLAATRP